MMSHFIVINPLTLAFPDKNIQLMSCTSFSFIKLEVDVPCSGCDLNDCDYHEGPGCGCGENDNFGGGCDLQPPAQASCDQDLCDNDICESKNQTNLGTDAPCITSDECGTDWSACYGSNDSCYYDCPCGCSDIKNQPLQGHDIYG